MSYINNPDTLSSSLYPLTYRSSESSAVIQQSIDVYIGGVLSGSLIAARSQVSAGLSIFDTNVQALANQSLAPNIDSITSVFSTLNTYSFSANTDVIKSLYCTAFNQTLNSSGFIQTSSSPIQSSTAFIYATDFYENEYNLNRFYQPSANPFYFLTSQEDLFTHGDANLFLSFYGEGTNATQIIFTFPNGSTAETIINNLNNTTNNDIYTTSIGGANIFGTSATFHVGNFPTNIDLYDYYDVSVGSYSGSFTRMSEIKRVYIEDNCNDNIELHWLGKYGGAESFLFKGLIEKNEVAKADIINLAQTWNVAGGLNKANSYDKQVIKANQTRSKAINVKCSLDADICLGIASLLYSPEVYIIEDDKYVNVTIENGNLVTDNNRATNIEFTFTIIYKNRVSSYL